MTFHISICKSNFQLKTVLCLLWDYYVCMCARCFKKLHFDGLYAKKSIGRHLALLHVFLLQMVGESYYFVNYMRSAWFQEMKSGRYLEFCAIIVHVLDVCMQHCFSNFLDCRRLLDSTRINRTQCQKWIRRMEFLYGIQKGERNTNLDFICNIPGVN